MIESNKLTKKEYWRNSWKNIKLPARYFYSNYSHIIISNLIEKFFSPEYKNFLEIGGCPGRWADYFYTKHGMVCDSMDYDEENVEITEKNYKMLGIKGNAFIGDITNENIILNEKYDIVLSDGLIEHFISSEDVFKNHLKYLKNGGLLIISVPNIKQSWLYNYFAKKDKVGYLGYRAVAKEELKKMAIKNNLKIEFCGYSGVFNIGVANTESLDFLGKFLFIFVELILNVFLKIFNVKKETKTFSPYIYLIAKIK